jgi:N-acetylmuramoyl-L-alanine amidase
MTGPSGRSIFVTNLAAIVARHGVQGIVDRAKKGHLSSVWIRVGRGAKIDPNLSAATLAQVRTALEVAGIALWGWHVPFCANQAAARDEAAKVLQWVSAGALAGLVVDAERTAESPRFQGSAAEATLYSQLVAKGLADAGRGIAFSSHDQPPLHGDLPFAAFLAVIPSACPQIYNTAADPIPRFKKSEAGYQPLLAPNFTNRYRPTGNICVREDVKFPDLATCLASVASFLGRVDASHYPGHSLWCWDDAPDEIWDLLHNIPPAAAGQFLAQPLETAMQLDQAYVDLKIVQDFVPSGASNRPGKPMKPISITIHNTDNASPGANAAAHARYMKGADAQKRQVSWHFTVDDKFIYQSIPTNEIAWHAGTSQGNSTSIAIEICMNPELDVPKTYDRAALLAAVIARRSGIQVPSQIFQHNHWSGKNCPIILRSKPHGWEDFVALVTQKFNALTEVAAADITLSGPGSHHD